MSGRVDFLIDTGASQTTIHSHDVSALRIRPDQLSQPRVLAHGVGGTATYVAEEAEVSLRDAESGGRWVFALPVYLKLPEGPERGRAADELPSLLGRDVLNSVRCALDASQGSVSLAPIPGVRGLTRLP